MLTTPLSEFTEEILFEFQDLSSGDAEHYIRQAAIAFCKQTKLFTEDHYQDIYKDQALYTINPPRYGSLIAVVKIDTSTALVPTWHTSNRAYILKPIPSADQKNGVKLTYAVMPKRGCCEVPNQLYEEYYMEIIAGAKQLIYEGHIYSNTSKAVLFQQKFKEGVAKAVTEKRRGKFVQTSGKMHKMFS